MELPHLGKNCALSQCNRLDFLPVKCDACKAIFCIEHYQYDAHLCTKAQDRNNQVPVCPLCSEPVATRKGQLPDVTVSEHMDRYCKSNDLIKNSHLKPKTNLQACSFKSCKQKDLIYLECNDCRSKFCIKHRHPTDHQCIGPSKFGKNLTDNWNSFKGECSSTASSSYELIKNKVNQISKSGQAALNRISNGRQSNSSGTSSANTNRLVGSLQGNLSESEALAIALNESTKSNSINKIAPNEDEDIALAKALQESEIEARNRSQNKDNCVLC